MLRVICNEDIHEFMYQKFPDILGKYIRSKVYNFPKDRFEYLNKLLQDEFKINIDVLISLFIKNLKINNRKHTDFYINVGDAEINNNNLESIVRTVDYGNSKFPPFNIFNSSLTYVNNNLEALYKYFYLGVN